MMGAVQPFLSGAISKTVNMPTDTKVDDVEQAYMLAWKLGIKALAIYRDGCKRTQPLNTSNEASSKNLPKLDEVESAAKAIAEAEARPARRRIPADCRSIRHKFDVAGHEGYIHIGFYDDGTPGEIFIKMAKEGSTISGLMDTIATLTSMSLQYGVPLEALVNKFSHVRFEPSGFTKNPEVPYAKSLTDYIFRFLGVRFQGAAATEEANELPLGPSLVDGPAVAPASQANVAFQQQTDAPSCSECGSIMIRNGSCYRCPECGTTSGCS